ncbi:hypothetical protein XX58_002751 [Salmonella enterica subsp. salamae]|uniref:DegT/DnrJ/EryC1/StrS aminotransferase family protein n=1 Tax=Salmonella enterica TaxID=28901 RepID=A0A603KY22_SALER|nr:hypothetical protein [Salmonella enterica subsp. salamae]EAM3924439.1 hypothetical protein [Salmonella enterica]EBP3809358.1 hypothetical protein [Salmonella enterica subsp. enterica]EDX4960428.1 hypothetical protein [Salmonella enterica subsp. salamae serovar 58:l,z13,z28:z6]EAO1724932.1 hypothetical protein [Salmonella enterica]
MRENNSAIGGYFSLEVQERKRNTVNKTIYLQSARACFQVLLERSKISRAWLPYYICDAVVNSINELGIDIQYYSITKDFTPLAFPVLKEHDVFVYVNYFGVCDEQTKLILQKYSAENVILDNSQAFYSGHNNNLGTIYSPRKFFGVPDGGILITDQSILLPSSQDNDSSQYINHLIGRLISHPSEYYNDYIKAEERLKKSKEAKIMSYFTRLLLDSISYKEIKKIRDDNFNFLHHALGRINGIKIPKIINGPLCYPFLSKNNKLKEMLLKNEIYVPTYWNDVLSRVDINSIEYELVSKLIPLPCDQRYSYLQMQKIVNIILEGNK